MESGKLFYDYATEVLGVDQKEAAKIADAIANKDYGSDLAHCKYYCLNVNEEGTFSWDEKTQIKDQKAFGSGTNKKEQLSFNTDEQRAEKNIYQKLIHDADCLDIIRVREVYDPKYLDFYQQFAAKDSSAKEDLAHLIISHRHLISLTGDEFYNSDLKKKSEYENAPHFYRKVLDQCLDQSNPNLDVIRKLYAGAKPLSREELLAQDLFDKGEYHPKKELHEDNNFQTINGRMVYYRGIQGFYQTVYPSKHGLTNARRNCTNSPDRMVFLPGQPRSHLNIKQDSRKGPFFKNRLWLFPILSRRLLCNSIGFIRNI